MFFPVERSSTPRRRETTGGSLGSNTSARNLNQNHARTRSNGVSTKQHQQQNDLDTGNKESVTYRLEWRINNITDLAMHVEGSGGGDTREGVAGTGESPSEVLRAGKQTVDGMYKFDLGEFSAT